MTEKCDECAYQDACDDVKDFKGRLWNLQKEFGIYLDIGKIKINKCDEFEVTGSI